MHPVEVRDLRKQFEFRQGLGGKVITTAVDGLTFDVSEGEVFSLLGPNGAGKTTTIKMLCTLIRPTSGSAWIGGVSLTEDPQGVRARIGVMLAGDRTVYWKLTARENLKYFAALYHLDPSKTKERIDAVLELLSLEDYERMPVESFSTGMRVRLSFAKTLLNDAPVLLLDEPTMSLDPQSARLVRNTIQELREKGKSILLTTHNLEEADRLSDRVGIIDKGKIIAMGQPAELKRAFKGGATVRITMGNSPEAAPRIISGIQGVQTVSVVPVSDSTESVLNVVVSNYRESVSDLLRVLSEAEIKITGISLVEPTLEDVFIGLTGRELRD